MFEDQTCLILGAGASRPYGFPTSTELRQLLLGEGCTEVFRDLGFARPESAAQRLEAHMFECSYQRKTPLQRFRTVFGESERQSIDSFLAGLPDTPLNEELQHIGHTGIAAVLLMCEAETRLTGNWYRWLLEFLLRAGQDFPAKRLSIVTFNYDRSLEQYLWRAFMRSFDLSPTDARLMLERIEFVHVYGSLGPLVLDRTENPVPFGSLESLFVAANNFAPANPRVVPKVLQRTREIIDQANRLIFLGFGFWPENLELIHPGPPEHLDEATYEGVWGGRKLFASCYNLWSSTIDEVNDRIGTIGGSPAIHWGSQGHDLWRFVTENRVSA